jgi:hypothetical protein
MTRALLLLAFASLAPLAAGCQNTSAPSRGPLVVYCPPVDGGAPDCMTLPGAMLLEAGSAWESAPWGGPGSGVHWLPFGAREQLQVQHGLGRVPTGVITYISFVEDGQNPGQAAGDLAQIVEVTADHVTVWNDTNGMYFARVVVF